MRLSIDYQSQAVASGLQLSDPETSARQTLADLTPIITDRLYGRW